MSQVESKTHFQKLQENEKDSRLQLVVSEGIKLMIWIKGFKQRDSYRAISYSKGKKILSLGAKENPSLRGKDVLYGFTLNGLSYFGKAKFNSTDQVDCTGDLFKSEKRKNFRLLTYPHLKVFLKVQTEIKMQDEGGNVVDFKTGMSQTSIFRNFLELMGSTDDELESDGYFSFRVLDLSVSGVSMIVNDANQELFEPGKIFTDMILKINGSVIEIPKAKSLYIIDMVSQSAMQKLKKVAFEFQEMSDSLDSELSQIINSSLRSSEVDFEDFV